MAIRSMRYLVGLSIVVAFALVGCTSDADKVSTTPPAATPTGKQQTGSQNATLNPEFDVNKTLGSKAK